MVHTTSSPAHQDKQAAIKELAESFSLVPASWISELAEHRGVSLPLPMWGWLWIVNGFVSPSMIQELLTDIEIASDEDARFVAAGWKGVGTTGMLAIEFDGELLLGIHGAGYDFYAAHWEPLYDALDL